MIFMQFYAMSNQTGIISSSIQQLIHRFWLEDTCLKGSECPFLHGYPAVVPRRRNRSEGDSHASDGRDRKSDKANKHRLSAFELTSDDDFPALGGAAEGTKVRIETEWRRLGSRFYLLYLLGVENR